MNKLFLLSASLLLLSLSACCTKKECVNAFDLNEIALSGFVSVPLDSVRVTAYTAGENFATELDRGFATAIDRTHGGSLVLMSPVELRADRDFKLEFIGSSLVYEITDIITGSEKCNSCFLKSDPFVVMESYQLNGQLVENAYFQLSN